MMLALNRLRLDITEFPADNGFLYLLEKWDKSNAIEIAIDKSDAISTIAKELYSSDRIASRDRTVCENTIISNVTIQGIMAVYLGVDMQWCKLNLGTLFLFTLNYVDSLKTLCLMLNMTLGLSIRPTILDDYAICKDNGQFDHDLRSAAIVRMMLSYIRYNVPVNKLCAMCEELSTHGFKLLMNEIYYGVLNGSTDTTSDEPISGNTKRSVSDCFRQSESIHRTSGDDD